MGLDRIRAKAKSKAKSTAKPKAKPKTPTRVAAPRTLVLHAEVHLTEDLIAQLATVVFRGNYRTIAAQACGVPPALFYRWIRKGEQDAMDFERGVLADVTLEHLLFVAINRAEAESHTHLLQDVLDADDHKVKLDFLKHRFKRLYSVGPNTREIDDTTGRESESVADVLRDRLLPLLRPEQRQVIEPVLHRGQVTQETREGGEQRLADKLQQIADRIH